MLLNFFPSDAGACPGDYYDTCADPLTVYETDYTKLLLPYLKAVQPDFDVCRDNWIAREQWDEVIRRIEGDMGHIQFDDTVFDFYTGFAAWITEALKLHQVIVAEGNQSLKSLKCQERRHRFPPA
ncbi:MAG: hypothetical protein LUH04_04965 [Clostridium sp.]|nr:hypothetical protein [Clostridium sp.]